MMRADIALLILALFFAVLLVVTPFLSPYGEFTGLDGSTVYIDHSELWMSKDPLTMVIYTMGDIFCPQMESRSLMLNGSQMAFCARDVSVLFGFVIGSLAGLSIRRDIGVRRALFIVISAFALMMMDWSVQHFMDINVTWSRVATGLLFGASIALLVSSYSHMLSDDR